MQVKYNESISCYNYSLILNSKGVELDILKVPYTTNHSIQKCKITVMVGLETILSSNQHLLAFLYGGHTAQCSDSIRYFALSLTFSNTHSIQSTMTVPYMCWYLLHTDSKDFTYSDCLVYAWKSTSHVETISITFRAYVNLIFICINFLLMMYTDCALLSWHSSLNLLYNSVSNCLYDVIF